MTENDLQKIDQQILEIDKKIADLKSGRYILSRKKFMTLTATSIAAFGLSGCASEIKNLEISQKENPLVINGVLTYGHENPLSQNRLEDLRSKLNSADFELDNETYYATMFIDKNTINDFNNKQNESFQSYLKRHIDYIDNQLKKANPPLRGGLQLRRLIIVENEVETPRSHYLHLEGGGTFRDLNTNKIYSIETGWRKEGMHDSDGAWQFEDEYEPSQKDFYDPQRKIDFGFLHEMGHSVLHLKDHYNLDISQSNNSVVQELPVHWKNYWANKRLDLSYNDIMQGGSGEMVRGYTTKLLHRRVEKGTTHNFLQTIGIETHGWPSEAPQAVDFTFIHNGQIIKPSLIEVYRSQKDDGDPMGDGAILYSTTNQIDFSNLFEVEQQVVKPDKGTLLLKINTAQGDYFRWMDIRDFNLAHWQGFTQECKMEMEILPIQPNLQITQEEFEWKIKYSQP